MSALGWLHRRKEACEAAGFPTSSPDVWRMLATLESEEPVDLEEFILLVTEPLGDYVTQAGKGRLLGLFGEEAQVRGAASVDEVQSMVAELGLDLSREELEDMIIKAGGGADGSLTLDAIEEAIRDVESDDD